VNVWGSATGRYRVERAAFNFVRFSSTMGLVAFGFGHSDVSKTLSEKRKRLIREFRVFDGPSCDWDNVLRSHVDGFRKYEFGRKH